MKKMKFSLIGLVLLTCACAMLQPKPVVSVYYRSDINTQSSKVIVFPLLSFEGKKTEGTKNVELGILNQWAEIAGKANIIPAGPALEQLPSATLLTFIKSIDTASSVEQLSQNPKIKEAIGMITSKLGNYNLALAIIDGGEKEFAAGSEVRLHIGLFDSQNMTWKWITKAVTRKGKLSRWEVASTTLVQDSFKEIKKAMSAETAKSK